MLKDLAAIFGPIGYTMKGVHKELIKGKQPTAFIRRARVIQGGKDVRALDKNEEKVVRERIDAAWLAIMEIKKEYDNTKKEGLIERIALARESRRLKKQGGFESVGKAQKAMRKWENDRKNHHDDKTQVNGHSFGDEGRQDEGIVEDGQRAESAAKQEHEAREEVHHARAVVNEHNEKTQAPPSSTTNTNTNTNTNTTNATNSTPNQTLQSKGVVAEDFAPETPMPQSENSKPMDLEQHIADDGDVAETEKRAHGRSLPTHGMTLGGL